MPSCWTRTTCVPVTGRIRSCVCSAIVGLLRASACARTVIIRGEMTVSSDPPDLERGPTPGFAISGAVAHHGRACAASREEHGRRREKRVMTARSKNHDWLALTVEEALEPELPICDPHHHLWDLQTARATPRYLLDEILADVGTGHNVVSTVFIECGAMFKSDGPEALRPVGETEFVNGIAAMSASGLYGKTRVAAGIIGTADVRL